MIGCRDAGRRRRQSRSGPASAIIDLPVSRDGQGGDGGDAVRLAGLFIPPAAARAAASTRSRRARRRCDPDRTYPGARRHRDSSCRARGTGTRIIGPNTAGVVTPGEGLHRHHARSQPNIFQPGRVGVISRSGSLGHLMCLNLTRAGIGQSAFLGIGGDPMIGTTTRDALQALDDDTRTTAVVMVGEIGGAMEEEAADYAADMKKPVVAFIAGRASPPGKKMGHAGAIVSGNVGSYAGKRRALEGAGVAVADTPREVPELITEALARTTGDRGLSGLAAQ